MTSELYIWIYLPGQHQPIVAGKLSITNTAVGRVGSFTYGKSYLSNPSAIPIDPVSLPLHGNIGRFTSLNGYPSAIMDSCPDRWGIQVINRIQGEQAIPLGYLLLNDPGRSGCLAFSKSAVIPPEELSGREFSLAELLHAAEAVEESKPVDIELLKALHPGTGGARPKCNIVDDGAVWIAKFPSSGDTPPISIPRLEHASMTLARACGINAAETRIKVVDGKDICLVRRFDRVLTNGIITRLGYLSARTVFYGDAGFDRFKIGSYPRLARWLHRFGTNYDGASELFRRMVFNCAIRNTDDHELNHGLVFDFARGYILSPAFDVLPQMKPHQIYQHALIIGDSAAGTINNLLSAHESFGLKKEEAAEIIGNVFAFVQEHWQDTFYECGFGDDEIHRVEKYFQRIPLNDE